MKIYGGETKMPIDVWSMVVITDQGLEMKIYGGENWNAHRCLIYGGDNQNAHKGKSMAVKLKCP